MLSNTASTALSAFIFVMPVLYTTSLTMSSLIKVASYSQPGSLPRPRACLTSLSIRILRFPARLRSRFVIKRMMGGTPQVVRAVRKTSLRLAIYRASVRPSATRYDSVHQSARDDRCYRRARHNRLKQDAPDDHAKAHDDVRNGNHWIHLIERWKAPPSSSPAEDKDRDNGEHRKDRKTETNKRE